MEHLDDPQPAPASPATDDKRPYEAPKVESVRLTQEAAESLT